MAKVAKGLLVAGAIILTAGAAGIVLGPAGAGLFSSMAGFYTAANALAISAFLNGVTAQLAGRGRGARAETGVEYAGTVEPRRIIYGEQLVSGMGLLKP